MASSLHSVNGQVCATGDGANSHVPSSFLAVAGAAEDYNLCCGEGDVGAPKIVSCLRDLISASDPLDRGVVGGGNVSVAVNMPLSTVVGVAVVSRVVV